MTRGTLAVSLFVLAAALAIRVQPVTSESFHFDAIVLQMAASEGVAANASDSPRAFELRRFHPPLVAYVIELNNSLTGRGAFRSRLYSIVFGAVACWLVALSVLAFGRQRAGSDEQGTRLPGTVAGAAIAGLLLCFLPVHLYISRTANWDAVYSALSLATLLFLSMHLVRPSRSTLVLAAVAGALSFLSCELGLALLPAVAVVLVADWRSGQRERRRWWMVAIAAALVTIVVLWPAGVLRLDALRTIRFRFYDSAVGQRNAPWTDFYSTLFHQAPAFTIAAILGVMILAWTALKRRRGGGGLLALLPFVCYAATVIALSVRQRLVYIHHIADLFPSLCVLAGAGFVVLFSRRPLWRIPVALVAVALVAGGVVSGTGDDPDVVGPQEHPGLISIGEFLLAHPGSRTYFHHKTQIEYYAPGADVEETPSYHWDADAIATAKVGGYDFVISDLAMLEGGDLIADEEELADALKPHYVLERVIRHRRTGEPVAWIFARRR